MRKTLTSARIDARHTAGFQLLRGSVLEVTSTGDILVEGEGDCSSLFCSFLRTSVGPPPAFGKGDAVLFLAGETDGRGYVLGVVEPLGEERVPDCLSLTAGHKVEIRCGKSSLTMNEDGKVVLRGAELTSRASGVNKIKGAAVKIN